MPFLLLGSAASQPAGGGTSPFPMAEAYCAPLYGSATEKGVSYCSARVSQCYAAEREARARIDPNWATISKNVRKACVAEAQQQFNAVAGKSSAVRQMIEDGGYANGYSVVTVEICVAKRLGKTPPSGMPPLPPQCVPSGSVALPSDENLSAEGQCAAILGQAAAPADVGGCIVRERSAKARLAALRPRLTQSVVASCLKRVTAPGFDGSSAYLSSSFTGCAEATLSDWGAGR